ncbi:MAG TPA: sigma-70 family RNA polymerase sigma factor [Anaerolineae bacterium]|nr:sigma-70 family RNA polymerase sigma factor [Anaerolineae bacterium]
MTEQEWITAAMHGDELAISWLVETYQPPVYGLCYRMLGTSTEAEDAAQDVLVKAVMSLHTFDVERPFKPWVLRIAANFCTDRLRRRRPEVSLDGMGEDGAWEWQAGTDPSPERQLEERERQRAVQALLETLAPVDRLVVTLFYWQDLSYEEIAAVTHLSVSAVKSRLFRARRALAACWAQTQGEESSRWNTGMREAHDVGHAQ